MTNIPILGSTMKAFIWVSTHHSFRLSTSHILEGIDKEVYVSKVGLSSDINDIPHPRVLSAQVSVKTPLLQVGIGCHLAMSTGHVRYV